MEVEDLRQLQVDARARKKYIWLKHSYDPNPLYGIFLFHDDLITGSETTDMHVFYIIAVSMDMRVRGSFLLQMCSGLMFPNSPMFLK